MRGYLHDLNVFAADNSYEPLSPEDLSKLDRKLTPDEYKAVSDWQSSQSEAQLAAERAKGGPRSAAVSVTSQGAVIERPKIITVQKTAIPWWAYLLGAFGVTVTGALIYRAVRK